MKKILSVITLIAICSVGVVQSKSKKTEKHEDHGTEKHEDHGTEKHEDHGTEKHEEHGTEKHEDHDTEKHEEHGTEKNGEEENSKIGPDKGILKASEELGFIISPEAYKNFGVQTLKLTSAAPWSLPSNARMLSQNEVNIYRIRDGYIKRIDFKVLTTQGISLKINSSDLKTGDEIITQGVGFVRIAELAAFGGAEEGHSH